MESVMEYAIKNNFIQMVEECDLKENSIEDIASEIFLNKMTIFQVAFFLAFAKICIERYPSYKQQIYEKVFKSIYKHMKF